MSDLLEERSSSLLHCPCGQEEEEDGGGDATERLMRREGEKVESFFRHGQR